ncbi:MAG: SRPBCC domain-containing protein [Planctomycetia bacterium]|nr:SRPBCC domain-containing protein [Planctomycetia bacterium]MCC7314841.1 SRPBCC domain-containing protein [Planctomycetota bacterium]
MSESKGPRSIEKEICILAPVDVVWKALTDAEELTRWFPLEAKVTPGEGGAVWMSWKNEFQFNTPIAVWEPNKRLRLIYMEPAPAAKPGEPGMPFEVPFQVALDYHLEDRSDETVLRLVHSGFSSEASWDGHYDGTSSGWNFQLGGLKFYLERHRGTPRRCVVCRAAIPHMSVADAWNSIMGPRGLVVVEHPAPRAAHERYAVTTASGDRFEGIVDSFSPPIDFSATVTNWNDAWLRLHIDDNALFCRRDVNLWISIYGLPEEHVSGLQERLDGLFAELFAPPATSGA